MEVNNGNKSDRMKKIESQSNAKVTNLLSWEVNVSVSVNLHQDFPFLLHFFLFFLLSFLVIFALIIFQSIVSLPVPLM